MTRYTIRPVLWLHKKNKDGLYPLMIALTVKRRVRYIGTNLRLKESQWHEGAVINYPNAAAANAVIRKQITEIEKDLLSRELAGEDIQGKKPIHSFEVFAKEVKGNTIANKKEIGRVKAFAGNVLLSEINVNFLRRYEQSERARGMSNNTVNTTFKWLRRILTQARQERVIRENPFDEYTVPRYIQTDRTYLVISEVDRIEKFVKTSPPDHLYVTAVWYLFGCYTGLRFSDWNEFDITGSIQNDRIVLRAKKNKNLVSIKIFKRLAAVLKRIKKIDKPYSLNKTNFFLKQIAYLCKIKKRVTCHTSRHTNATLLATMGVSSDTAAELLGVDRKTIDIYYKITGVKIDKETAVMNKL